MPAEHCTTALRSAMLAAARGPFMTAGDDRESERPPKATPVSCNAEHYTKQAQLSGRQVTHSSHSGSLQSRRRVVQGPSIRSVLRASSDPSRWNLHGPTERRSPSTISHEGPERVDRPRGPNTGARVTETRTHRVLGEPHAQSLRSAPTQWQRAKQIGPKSGTDLDSAAESARFLVQLCPNTNRKLAPRR